MRPVLAVVRTVLFAGVLAVPAARAAIPAGAGQQVAEIGGQTIQVFTYRPDGCATAGMLIVFHGLLRNAANYRDDAKPLADRLCLVVVAPLFDEARFPTWRYQQGGIVHAGQVQPAADWTVDLVPLLVAWVRTQENRADLPYSLLGHSAGAQFLSRVAAFVPLAATRIVIADPSTWVLPTTDTAAPFGFGGVFDPAQTEQALRRYLAAPVTVLLGEEDTGSRYLSATQQAEAQGANRLERGQNAFRMAQAAARSRGWPFGWRLVLVPGVAHDARRNFASPQTLDALRP